MQTYSHLIITAALSQSLQDDLKLPVHTRAFLLGSFAPDMALGVLSAQYLLKRRLRGEESIWCSEDYNHTFFNQPAWIISHNLLHAPLLLVGLMLLGYGVGSRWGHDWGWSLLWFALGCGLHTLLDIPTHHNDGPLLLFPLEHTQRFSSPLSYWDREHGASVFGPFERLLDGLLLLRLIVRVLQARHRQR